MLAKRKRKRKGKKERIEGVGSDGVTEEAQETCNKKIQPSLDASGPSWRK